MGVVKLDSEWLAQRGLTIRPTVPSRALADRLKFVAGIVSAASELPANGPRLLWRDQGGTIAFSILSPRFTVGRDDGCDLRLTDPRISRRHCEIILLRGVSWLSDLGSSNGTFHNGERVRVPVALREGDLVEIGGSVLVFLD